MKIILLFTALAIVFTGNAQSLTQANEPTIGEEVTMYVCDTIDPYAANQGTGVSWDYSMIVRLTGQTRVVGAYNPNASTNGALFPTSTFTLSAGTELTSFCTSTSTERMQQGFVFNGPNLGEVIAIFDVDELKLMDYPFSNGSTLTDTLQGQITLSLFGVPQTLPIIGIMHASVDGQGTLTLPGPTTFTDVIRYHSIDTTFIPYWFGSIELIRNYYEYYDLANTNIPVFTHRTLVTQGQGATTPMNYETEILSSVDPDLFLAVNDVETIEFDIYPNPATNEIILHGDFSSNAVATIYDQSGRTISSHILSNGNNLNVSSLEAGTYIVYVQTADFIAKKTMIIK
tara:strand:+ start:3437 stop:4465 length:1029 start_codon:yes stop_codon:yes gene_type:complete